MNNKQHAQDETSSEEPITPQRPAHEPEETPIQFRLNLTQQYNQCNHTGQCNHSNEEQPRMTNTQPFLLNYDLQQKSQQAIPEQYHVQESPQTIQHSEAVQVTSHDEIPTMTMMDLFKKVYEQPREVMQQLSNYTVEQSYTQPQQVYNEFTNPANKPAKQAS